MAKDRMIWTEESVEELIELWPTTKGKDIAERLGCSTQSIFNVVKVIRAEDPKLVPARPKGGFLVEIVRRVALKRKK